MSYDPIAYFTAKLAHETDASDVYGAQKAGDRFVLVDVRGEAAWMQGRVAGALHMPHREIVERAPVELDASIPVIVYCWGPGCNGGARGALAFARLGFQVTEMIGGYEYWVREGQPTENNEGSLPRTFDPLTMPARQRAK